MSELEEPTAEEPPVRESLSPERDVAPWTKRAMALAAAVAVGTSVVGSALVPYLLTHYPIALLALAPEPRHVVLATGVLPAGVVIGVAVTRRVLGLLALYGFGWAYGPKAVSYIEERFGRAGRFLRWVEGKLARYGLLVIAAVPTPSVVTLSGVAGVSLGPAVLAMTLGQVFWVTVTWAFGEWIGTFVEPVVRFLGNHVLEATLVTVGIVGAWQLASHLKRRGTPPTDDAQTDDAQTDDAQTDDAQTDDAQTDDAAR